MSFFISDDAPPQRGRVRAPIGEDAYMCEFFGSVYTAGDHPCKTTIVKNSSMERWTFFDNFWSMQAWVQKYHEQPIKQTTLKDVMPAILANSNEKHEA